MMSNRPWSHAAALLLVTTIVFLASGVGPVQAIVPEPPTIVVEVQSTIASNSPDPSIGAFSSVRSVARGFDGKLHAVWSETGIPTPRVMYASSPDNGATWSVPYLVRQASTVYGQPAIKLDDESTVHLIWPEWSSDYVRTMHRKVGADGTWGPPIAMSTSTADEIAFAPNPAMNLDGTMSLLFDKSHYRGIGIKTWNGTAWSGTGPAAVWGRDTRAQNTVPAGSDLHTFMYDTLYQKLVYTGRSAGVWSTPSLITTFTVMQDHSEVIDDSAAIRIFASDLQTNRRLMAAELALPSRVFSVWQVLDSEPGLHAQQPSATVDHLGNVWVFYSLGEEICYKVLDKASGQWSARQYLTDVAVDGVASSPKARYQAYHNRAGGRIDLTYRVNGVSGFYALKYRGLVLENVNDLPAGIADKYSLQIDEGVQVPAPGVLGNDQDADRDPLTATLGLTVDHGTLSFSSDGAFEYTPEAGWSGTDSFEYTCSDGSGSSASTLVDLVVIPHYAPTATADAYSATSGHDVTIAAPGVLANDYDLNVEDSLTAVLASEPSTGVLDLEADGSFRYTAPEGFRDPVTFTYRATDGTLESPEATVRLTLNHSPNAAPEGYATNEYGVLKVSALEGVLGNDSDPNGDSLTASMTLAPSRGSLSLAPDGSFTYIPGNGLSGSDTFKYVASDGALQSVPVTVNLFVSNGAAVDGHVYDATNGAPLAGIVVRAVNADAADPEEGNWLTAVTDADGHYRLTGLTDDAFTFVSFIDRNGAYRDEHLWSQTVPIDASYPGFFVELTSGVDAYLIPESIAKSDRVTRIAGDSRYDTAVKSSQFWPNSDVVVLASGVGYADALSAAPLAGSYRAPILLTPAAALPSAVSTEITRLKAKKVIIVGGTSAVSSSLEQGLKNRGLSVTRVSGADRYATCLAITRHLIWREGDGLAPEPFIVRGDNYADALAVAPFAWSQVRPIILVRPTAAPYASVTAFSELGSDSVVIVGGESAVGEDALYDLWFGALYPDGLDLTYWRVAGKNRYDTAVKAGRFWGSHFDKYVIASGQSFPDALAGGPLMGAYGGAMLLTAPQSLSPEPAAVLAEDKLYISDAWVLGGDKAVTPAVLTAAASKVGTGLYQMDGYAGVETAAPSPTRSAGASGLLGALAVERHETWPFADRSPAPVIASDAEVFRPAR